MTIDKQKLKALAEAATQGEWERDGHQVCPVADQNASLGSFSKRSDAAYVAALQPSVVLALLAEIEHAENRLHDVAVLCATVEHERDQLKTENEALRKDAERYRYMRRVWAPHLSQDEADTQTDAAMAKEASHG
ncbi:ead/Ea22-like family protein [Pseudomonas wayambapalatensis]|nr:ead/Ea22-like family protein [Pseudomonas wayambapalatensis]